jgi:predicted small lipoprotein YifL
MARLGLMIRDLMLKRSQIVLAATLAAFALAGCGARGPLEAPPSAKADPAATAESGQGKPAGSTDKAHKPFILDGLIR